MFNNTYCYIMRQQNNSINDIPMKTTELRYNRQQSKYHLRMVYIPLLMTHGLQMIG